MNIRFLTMIMLLTSSSLFLTGCSEDNSSFETPNTSGTQTNNNPISQKNFTLLFNPVSVAYVDLINGGFTAATAEISVQIGDNNNQLITGERTIHFRTEWGLIDPFCTTENGTCSVTWRSGSPDDMPTNFLSNIIAYSSNGQESFLDINGNSLFDDGDSFSDLDEPYLDNDESGSFTAGDIIIDTINGIDLTGADTTHNNGDAVYNGPNCSHSTLCSTILTSSTVWEDGSLRLTTNSFTIGGTISGLSGSVTLQNFGANNLTVTTDGTFTFAGTVPPGSSYSVTVAIHPPGQICTVTVGTGAGIANSNVESINITCS